jgi:hypothetical protein
MPAQSARLPLKRPPRAARLPVFDVLAIDGEPVDGRPYGERRALLESLDFGGTRSGVKPYSCFG